MLKAAKLCGQKYVKYDNMSKAKFQHFLNNRKFMITNMKKKISFDNGKCTTKTPWMTTYLL